MKTLTISLHLLVLALQIATILSVIYLASELEEKVELILGPAEDYAEDYSSRYSTYEISQLPEEDDEEEYRERKGLPPRNINVQGSPTSDIPEGEYGSSKGKELQ
jgi:hypothetical protein